jgi:cardiolipin synthase A/B
MYGSERACCKSRVLVSVLTTFEIAYVVVACVVLVLQKRSPTATVAWLLILVAIPLAGIVLFFVFGPRRLRRRRLKRQRGRLKIRSREILREVLERSPVHAHETHVDTRLRQVMELAMRVSDIPPELCSNVEIISDGTQCFDAIEKSIASAKHHVHLGYYIFAPGCVGTRIRDLLIERAKAGVHVRLLVDAVGSYALTRRFLRPLREARAEVVLFNPVNFARFRSRINFRNHRKIIVIDGRVAFTGGFNVADEYLEAQRGGLPWRDVHVRLEGGAVRWLQLLFLEDWYFATDKTPHGRDYFPEAKRDSFSRVRNEEHRVQIVASGPDLDAEAIHKVYFAAIAGAEKRVLVTTPYFVPDESVLTALLTAALRGLDVRILVPKRSDSQVVSAAARSYFDELIAAGVRIFEYTPAMLHAKTLVIDDAIACVGSANMDTRSFRLNFEVSALLYGSHHNHVLAELFERNLEGANEVRASSRANLRLSARIFEAGARLLSPLL